MIHRCVFSVLALAAATAPVGAQTVSPYSIGISQTFSHDNNLLRLSNGVDAPSGYSPADTVSSTALLANIDQPFGRQRAYANLSLRNNRYSGNDIFNNTSYSASAGLDWQTVERISGSLSTSANRSLQRFNTDEIGFVAKKNLESVETVGASLSVGVVTEYSFELTGGRRQVRNSLQELNVQARQFNQDNATAGIKWRPRAATTVGLALGTTQGRYPKYRTLATGEFQADRFQRHDIILTGTLKATGASTFDARLASGRTTYDLNQQRNFSGLTGLVAWGWQPTAKLRFSTTAQRDTGQDSYAITVFNTPANSDYSRVNSVLRVQADYEFSAKIAFSSNLQYGHRSLVRTLDTTNRPQDTASDNTTSFALGGRWSPLRNTLLGCDVSFERRRGNGSALTSNLGSTNYGCYGQISLQ